MSLTSHRTFILDILESAVANVQKNKDIINELNVFPVPDGDTGSNMLSTLISAWNNIDSELKTDVEIMKAFSQGALLGARGNSGVIISQIIKGISVGIEKTSRFSFNVGDIKIILEEAKTFAYTAVQSPVEGTILTVVRELSEKFNPKKTDKFDVAIKELVNIAQVSTDNTPNLLPILKEANVVDSGAYGLLKFLEGIVMGAAGIGLKIKINTEEEKTEVITKADPNNNIGYCTEFLLTLKNPKKFNLDEFKKKLELLGDSIVAIVDEDTLKVHVHSKTPGKIFSLAHPYGEFSMIKADNMTTQTVNQGHKVHNNSFEIYEKEDNINNLAIIAVANGPGLRKIYSEHGATYIVGGGQTMNPSVNDFKKLIDSISNKNILILPNNSNIVLTAEAVKKSYEKTDRKIHVLPTKSLQQGLVALYNINQEMSDFQNYKDDIHQITSTLREGHITTSIRDTKMNNVNVKKGDFISLMNSKIINSSKSLKDAVIDLVIEIDKSNPEIITIIYNREINNEFIDAVTKHFKKIKKDFVIEFIYGGQGVYPALIFGEN